MTEIPMLVATLGAALLLWESSPGGGKELLSGMLFGIALGIREQALTLAGVFLWIVWVRRQCLPERLWTACRFGSIGLVVALAPVVWLYFRDPQAFAQRIQVWLQAIPTSEIHLWRNLEATLLYTFLLAPAAWLALLGGAVFRWMRGATGSARPVVPAPLLGFVCCLVLPLLPLLRDADVQIHPRYTLVALPGAVILCAGLYGRWLPAARAVACWGLLHLAVFGLAQVAIQPFRQMQTAKKEYAQWLRATIHGNALLISGGYSPVFDYYRAVGDRPQWRICWSGWDWNPQRAAAMIAEAWARNEPVYLCDGPYAWLFFENERLDLHFVLSGSRREIVAPGLSRIYSK